MRHAQRVAPHRLAAVACAIALLSSASCSEDDPEDSVPPTVAESPTTSDLVVSDVDDLAAAIGCDDVESADFVAAPDAETTHYCHLDSGPTAILHITDGAEGHQALIAKVTADEPWTISGPGDTVPRDLWVVAGDNWVASAHDQGRVRDIAAKADGELLTSEPIGPPPSYQ